MHACILTMVVTAYLVAAAPGDLSYVHWFEIEPAKEIHAKIAVESWELFKAEHNKEYVSIEEEAYRRSVFTDNLKKIEIHNQKFNKGEKSYWLGVNHFTDLTTEEFKALHSGCVRMKVNQTAATCSTFLPPHNVMLPDAVDWREKGYVTPIKNQGHCGSCWSFSATGSMEGQLFRNTGQLISLSEQQLVDCSLDFGNQGCRGGWMDQAFEYIRVYGIESEEAYTYKAKDEECKYSSSKVVARDIGCVDIESGSESVLQQAVGTIGPISIAINSNHSLFRHYSGGVYEEEDCSSTNLDHAVLAVGYGTEDGKDYWLVKNSWGERWGENGYIKMARNKGNMCGIATSASYPLV